MYSICFILILYSFSAMESLCLPLPLFYSPGSATLQTLQVWLRMRSLQNRQVLLRNPKGASIAIFKEVGVHLCGGGVVGNSIPCIWPCSGGHVKVKFIFSVCPSLSIKRMTFHLMATAADLQGLNESQEEVCKFTKHQSHHRKDTED